jgi:HEAT repeat protein
VRPLVYACCFLVACTILSASSQARPASAADPYATAMARAWSAYAAHQFAAAAKASEDALRLRPGDHDARAMQVRAMAATAWRPALDTYEAALRAGAAEDRGMLPPVATEALRELSGSTDLMLRQEALIALVRGHDEKARADLRQMIEDGTALPTADIDLAQGGDAEAAKRMESAVRNPNLLDKTALIEALADHPSSSSTPILRELLTDPNPVTRASAARAIGVARDAESVATLQKMAESDTDPAVRVNAVLGLAAIGDPAVEPQVQNMLASPVPDLRLAAAETLARRGGAEWIPAITPLLREEQPISRLRAAELLARYGPDPAAARDVLREALGSDNPIVRREAAHGMASAAGAATDIATLRSMLRSPDAWTRLSAADTLSRP